MFNTRADVDRHVQNCMKKVNNETERNIRCLSFAKLYLQVGDYEQARRYVSTYLGAKPQSAEAQLVLGEALEKLGKHDAALEAYRSSLDINPKQNKLLIKICELLSSNDVDFDQSYVRYYCEKAQSVEPSNPIVFNLKEKLLSSSAKDPKEISQLFLREIESRPDDLPTLGIRLLRHLLENSLICEAYEHVLKFERKHSSDGFTNNIQWFETVASVLVRYQRENLSVNLSWEYWMLSISTLNNLALLSLDERSVNIKSLADCVAAAFNFDQSLKVAAENVKDCPHKQLTQEFLKHYRGQLCFHFLTLIYKLAKVNSLKYKEASQMALPLLFLAYHTPPPEVRSMWLDSAPEAVRAQMLRWHREASFRCSQTGHILLAAAKDQQKTLLEKATLESSGYWQEKLFKKLFVLREQQNKIASSYFATSAELGEPSLRLPDLTELVAHDERAQPIYPDSLHHYVWTGLDQDLSRMKLAAFDGLQYSVRNLGNCSAESLNVLDIHSFVFAAILCAQSQIEDAKHVTYSNPNKPNLLPAAVTDTLGTLNQSKWLTAAWKMYRNDYRSNFGEMRLTLIKGIEVVRCTGNHGMDVKLLVLLARVFTDRLQHLSKQSEVEFNGARAELFWKAALPILEKLKNNQVVSYAPNKLFDFKSKEMSLSEILGHIENGKLFSGAQLMKKKDYEKALQIFETLKDPYASFYQAQIYKTLAEEQTSFNKENVTSEMRSQRITLLSHVRDYLYLTLDRLRDPTVDKKHPLNAQLATEIEKIDRLLSRIDPDVSNRNECDGMSDENSSYSSIQEHHFQSFTTTNGISPKNDALLRVESTFRREARPSPERLDAQLRQLVASKDSAMHNILEQNKVMVESHKVLIDELRSFKDVVANLSVTVNDLRTMKHTVDELKGLKSSVDELKVSVDELQNFRTVTDMVYEMRKELAELKKDAGKTKSNTTALNEEDLYALDDEYQDFANVPNLGNFYPNRLPGANPGTAGAAAAAAAALYGTHSLYQGLAMGYPMMPYGPMSYQLPFAPPESHVPPLLNSSLFGQQQQALIPPLVQQQQQQQQQQAQMQAQQYASGVFNKETPSPSSSAHLFLNQSQTLLSSPKGVEAAQRSGPSEVLPGQQFPGGALGRDRLFLNQSQPLISSPSKGLEIAPSMKAGPVNVVITSSDPLPTAKTVTTPQVLSVSIPPQHLKGNKTPHSYQIPMPVASGVGTTVTAPSVMNQTPLPVITTRSLLANVSAPVYSSITDKNAGLGFQIEKSLTQSFNATSTSADLELSGSFEEADPCPDFKPVVPLPAEVPLNTGEEGEQVLFCERAKLFRFVEKEWRERGVGNIKILHNTDTGRVRILMRRDQVHKICANHFITSDMNLTPMPNSGDRVYVWAAQDFADESVVVEKLSVRFKTETEAKKFQQAFESAKKLIAGGVSSRAETPSKTALTQPASLGGFVFTSTPTFKPKQAELVQTPPMAPQEAQKLSPFASFSFLKTPSTSTATPISATTPTTIAQKTTEQTKAAITLTPKLLSKLDGSGDAEDLQHEDFVPTAEFKPVVPLPDLIEVKTGEENAQVLFEHKAKLLRFDVETKEWKERGIGQMKILKQGELVRFLMRRDQVHKVCCNHQLLKEMNFQKMAKNPKAVTWYAEDFSDGELKRELFAIKFKTEDIVNDFLQAVTKSQEALNRVEDDDDDDGDGRKGDKKTRPDSSTTPSPGKGFGDKFKPKSGSWGCKNCYVVNEAKVNYCSACETPKNDSVPKKQPESGPQFSFGVKTGIQFASTDSSPQQVSQPHFVFGQKTTDATSTSSDSASASTGANNFLFGAQKTYGQPAGTTTPSVTFNFGNTPATTSGAKAVITTTTTASSAKSSGFGDAFKVKPDSWECPTCLVRNDGDKTHCPACETPKNPSIPAKDNKPKGVDLDTHGLTFQFGTLSPAVSVTAVKKSDASDSGNSNKSESTMSSSTSSSFKFGAGGGFTFNTPTEVKTTETKPLDLSANFDFKSLVDNDKEQDKVVEKDKFVFGSPQQHGFEFTPRSPRRHSSGAGEEDSENSSYLEEEADHIYFKPVIPMPDKVDVRTGEEGEEVLYCHRAKLFRFRDGEWKERGVGDVKILRKKDTSKLRILMRREKIHKICLNHVLTKDIEYLPKDGKSWLFAAADYSEGEIERDKFCLRFKNVEIASEFKTAVEDALTGKLEPAKALKPIPESDSSDVELVSETVVSEEEQREAVKLGLPPKFFAYRQLPDCTCEQCKKEDELLKDLLKPSAITHTSSAKQSTFSFTLPKTDTPSIFGNVSVSSSTTSTPFSFTTALSNANNTTPTAGSIFGSISGNIFTTPTETPEQKTSASFTSSENIFSTPFVQKSESIFGNIAATPVGNAEEKVATTTTTATASIFGSKPTFSAGGNIFANSMHPSGDVSRSPLMGGLKGSGDAPKFTSTVSLSGNTPIFDSNLSFASLLNQDGPAKFNIIEENDANPFASLGAGAPVFGGSSAGSKPDKPKIEEKDKNEEDDGTEAVANEEYDPHYEPIVPLPEAITVSTGEEDEVALFNERAKVYRYDGKEWKERGVGQLKILHHPQKNTYRLLLRREQVHKVVLNQLISPDLNMQPMVTSDKAWLWGGYNYAEDEPALEKLAARFKTVELARKFFDVVDDVLRKIQQQQLIPTSVANIENVSDEERVSDEEVEDEEDYDDDERSIMFARTCNFSAEVAPGIWQDMGKKDLQVYYDSDFYGSRIAVYDESGLAVSNTLIGINTIMTKDDSSCTWKAVEWANNLFAWRNLRATFDNLDEANEFFVSYEEGVGYAKHSDIVDDIPSGTECI